MYRVIRSETEVSVLKHNGETVFKALITDIIISNGEPKKIEHASDTEILDALVRNGVVS